MKKLLSVVLAVIIAFGTFSVAASAAESFASGVIVAEDGREFTWDIQRQYGTLRIYGEGEMPELSESPEWLQYDFTNIVIGDGITSVSDEAFLNADFLGNNEIIEFPESLKKIGDRAFYGCRLISEIDLSAITSIGSMAFYGCSGLKEFFIPAEVEEIGAYAIGYYCNEELDNEFAKIEDVKIYSYLNTTAHNYAVENEIEFVDLNDYSAFFTYEKYDEESVILTSYENCEYSKNISVPAKIDGFKVIGLGEFLFENTDVESVNVPNTVNRIHETAFLNAKKLKSISVQEGGRFASYEGGLYNKELTILYKYPEGADIVSFPEAIKEIGKEAFRGSAVTEISLPETVSSIDEGAFSYSSLKKIELSEGVTAIPQWAFASCESLSEISFNRITEIGENAFRGCKSLENVSFSAELKKIGAASFHGTGLKSVIIPDTVTNIGEKAFGYYSEDDVEFVKDEAFVIYGKSESSGKNYADKNGFEFVEWAPECPEIYYSYADTKAISIFWMKTSDAEYYELYRKTKDTEYELIYTATPNSKLYYVDFNVKNGEKYTYSVVAVKNGFRSDFDSKVTFKFVKLATPVLKSAEMTLDGILVTWNSVKNAEGYTIYRKTENGKWSRIADFKGNVTSFEDTTAKSGVNYTYTVKAYLDDIESGYNANGVSAMYLSIPKLKKAENASKGITVTWEKVKGANGYIIGRKTSKTSWVKIATLGDVSSYTDKTAKLGTTYTYTVVPVCDDVFGYYDDNGVTCKCVGMPKIESVSNASGGVSIKWNAVSKCSGYIVYRKTSGGSWKRLTKITDSAKTSYTDKTAKSGTKYYYAVKAYSGSTMSAYKTVSLVRLTTPKLVEAKSTKSGVRFQWGKVSGAEGYYIYRATGNGSFKKIATVKSGTTVSFVDKTSKKGVTYRYTVKAYKESSKSAHNTKGLSVKDKH